MFLASFLDDIFSPREKNEGGGVSLNFCFILNNSPFCLGHINGELSHSYTYYKCTTGKQTNIQAIIQCSTFIIFKDFVIMLLLFFMIILNSV